MAYEPTKTWKKGDKIYHQDMNHIEGGIENLSKIFVVECTPTALDFSGTMNHTVGEIYEEFFTNGKRVFFMINTGTGKYFGEVTAVWEQVNVNYPSFNAQLLLTDPNVFEGLIQVATGTTFDSESVSYLTILYPLTRM